MPDLRYRDIAAEPAGPGLVRVAFRVENRGSRAFETGESCRMAWQIYDPETSRFISEGEWSAERARVEPGQSREYKFNVAVPRQDGPYRVYFAPLDDARGWSYAAGDPFVVADVQVASGAPALATAREATLGRLRRESAVRALPKLGTGPVEAIYSNWRLIRSLVRRDIQARYRGSFGDVLWTVLNPLLLMATYFFVFGIVLHARFGGDPSPFGFVLYFLAGMMPWLAISEAVGRAPGIVVDNRNFVKKLLFPLETLPINVVASGLVNELIALVIFALLIFVARGAVPLTAVWLPVLLIPQIALALGISWFLAGVGVYVRDLGQAIGFVLTLWFFLTPICYPDAQLPGWAMHILGKNPLYTLVRGYRLILLEGRPPEFQSMWKLWLLAAFLLVVGFAAFTRMRRSFADVI